MASSTKHQDRSQPIRVFIRSRPLSQQEIEARSSTCVDLVNSKELVIRQQYGKRYSFERVFGPSIKQVEVYSNVVEPLIPEVLAGYNCTVFAYGQTGTGKTYTMAGGSVFSAGVSWQDDLDAGIIPRALSHLFDELHIIKQQYTVRVSYLELYNEELFDLLSDNVEGKSIRLFEDPHQKGSVIIHGITKETVHNKNEVYEILQRGQDRRRTAATLLNAQSSRSHTVFSIMVHTCETTLEGEELVKTGKLNLVDLAGSENIGRSGAVDRRAREAGNINQSLLTLGRVIKALVEKCAHIPYRESKLTRILQDSLGGRTKTSIIATISPAASCSEETISTLDYANRARNITNRPEVNQRVSQKAWKAQYEKELERLRKDLQAACTGGGVYLHQENYDRLVNDSEMCKEELAEKIAIVRQLEIELRNMHEQKQLQLIEWNELLDSFKTTRNKLDAYRDKLKKTAMEKKEQEHLASCFESKATTLHHQAQTLLGITKTTALNYRKKILHLCSVSEENNDSIKKVSDDVIKKCQGITNELIEFMFQLKGSSERVANLVLRLQEQHTNRCDSINTYGSKVTEEAGTFLCVACQNIEKACAIDYDEHEKFLNKVQSKIQEVHDMTEWVDVTIDLENIRIELCSDLESTKQNLIKQENIRKDTTKHIRIIKEEMKTMMDSVTNKLQYLEDNISQSEDINKDCLELVNNAQELAEERILKVSSDLEINTVQAAYLLREAVNIVEEYKKRDIAIDKVIEHLEICKENFGHANIVPTEGKLTMQKCLETLNNTTKHHTTAAKDSLIQFTSNTDEIQKEVSQLTTVATQHENIVTTGLKESQESLTNFISNTLIDLSPGGGTPVRLQFDPNTLTQASPKERILMRFRDQYKDILLNETLDFDEEEVPLPSISIVESSTECEETETDFSSNVLKPIILDDEPSQPGSSKRRSPMGVAAAKSKVQRVKSPTVEQKPQESDKENTPGLEANTT